MSAIRSVPRSGDRILSIPANLVVGLAHHDGWWLLALAAYSAAALPARAPKTRHSGSELEPNRFAPLMLTHAVSPAANSPSMGVAPLMSVCTPPIM